MLRKGKKIQILKSWSNFWDKELQSITGERASPSLGLQFLLGLCCCFQLLSTDLALLDSFFFTLLLQEPALNPRLPKGSWPLLQAAVNHGRTPNSRCSFQQ